MTTTEKCDSILRIYFRLLASGLDHDGAVADICKNLGITRNAVGYALGRSIQS